MTIFRIIRFLELRGHRCTIWFSSIASGRSTILIRDEITKHFQTLGADIKIAGDELFETSGDAIVATGWQTVPFVAHSQHFKRRFYFVQDFEPAFYPAGSHSAAAEETYRLGLDCICASPWLEKKMIDRGMWARSFLLAADLDVYHAAPRARHDLPKIAFYYRRSPRRLPELGLLALEELARRGVRFEVHSFGTSEPPTTEAPFLLVHRGILPPKSIARLYADCDIGLCFSATNYSLVPQEMMASGCAVVEFDTDSTRTIFPSEVITLAGPRPDDIASAIQELIEDPVLRTRQAKAATEWVRQFSWERAAAVVEDAFIDQIAGNGFAAKTAKAEPRESKATVVIPTYNGGDLLKQVVNRVLRQRAPWAFDVLIVDSSSDDGTRDFCRSVPQIQFEEDSEIGIWPWSHTQPRDIEVQYAFCRLPDARRPAG